MKADVVIVNYRTHVKTANAVSSVLAHCDVGKIIVVDNSDASAHWASLVEILLPECTNELVSDCHCIDGKLIVLKAPGNLGFGGGCNFAVENGGLGSQLIWFVNSDCELYEDVLEPLASGMAESEYVALSSVVYNQGSSRDYSEGNIQVWRVSNFFGWFRNVAEGYDEAKIEPSGVIESFSCYGASFVVRRAQFVAIGGFDENYFMYLEETDLIYRLKAMLGGKCGFVAKSRIFHEGGGSADESNKKRYRILKNYYYFVRKNYKGIQLATGLLFFGCKFGLFVLRVLLNKKGK